MYWARIVFIMVFSHNSLSYMFFSVYFSMFSLLFPLFLPSLLSEDEVLISENNWFFCYDFDFKKINCLNSVSCMLLNFSDSHVK